MSSIISLKQVLLLLTSFILWTTCTIPVCAWGCNEPVYRGEDTELWALALPTNALSAYIKVCHRDDPKLVTCINDSITFLKPYLKNGIPELDVPPLEPLLLDAVDLKSGNNATRIESTISNLKIWGPTSFVIQELKPNLNKNVFKFTVLLPKLNVVGRYKTDARVLFFNLKGEGPAYINITDYKFECKLKGNKIMKEGDEFLEFEKMKLKIEVGSSSIRLENLFNGDPVLGKATSDVVNENSNLFISEILPNLQQALSEKFTNIANKITLRFTYKELFPY